MQDFSIVPKFVDSAIKEVVFLDESVRLPLYRLPAQRGTRQVCFRFLMVAFRLRESAEASAEALCAVSHKAINAFSADTFFPQPLGRY